eukprot:218229_1
MQTIIFILIAFLFGVNNGTDCSMHLDQQACVADSCCWWNAMGGCVQLLVSYNVTCNNNNNNNHNNALMEVEKELVSENLKVYDLENKNYQMNKEMKEDIASANLKINILVAFSVSLIILFIIGCKWIRKENKVDEKVDNVTEQSETIQLN